MSDQVLEHGRRVWKMRAEMIRITQAAVVALAVSVPLGSSLADSSPVSYAGRQTRAIKALSEEDIAPLLNGEGMGMAKAAELNGYPGPKHVLTALLVPPPGPTCSALLSPSSAARSGQRRNPAVFSTGCQAPSTTCAGAMRLAP